MLINTAASIYGCTPDQITGLCREPALNHARWAVMLVLRRKGGSYPQIGQRLCRDHSTVIYGVRKAQGIATIDAAFAAAVSKLEAAI